MGIGACKDESSSLAQLAEDEEAKVRASFEYAEFPAAPPAPAEVDAQLWADVANYPASITELGLIPRAFGVIAWAEANVGKIPKCKTVLDGIDRYYMVHLDDDQQRASTLVFHGKLDRLAVEGCVRRVFTELGFSSNWALETEGPMTRFGRDGVSHALLWAQRGDEYIVAYDTEPERLEGMFSGADPLATDADLTGLLAGLTPTPNHAVVVGRRDFGAVLTRTPSTGFRGDFGMDLTGVHAGMELAYASAEQASAASEGLDVFIAELRERGVVLLVNEGVEGSLLALRFEPQAELLEDPETKLRPVLELLATRVEEQGLELDVEELMGYARGAAGL